MKDSTVQVHLTSDEAFPWPRGDVGAHGRMRGSLPFCLPQPVAGDVFNWLENMCECSGRTATVQSAAEWVIYPSEL